LALLLDFGARPLAVTAGFADSTDVVVARMITRAVGLEHRVVELRPDDYLTHAREIVRVTSGTKTAAHWHTDLYVRAAAISRDDVHYVGSNGEFARSYYLDRGSVAQVLGPGPRALMEVFFAAKVARRARRFPPALLAPGPSLVESARHVTSMVEPFTRSFADGLDCFYATQRVRHFIGNGLALYAQHSRPRSPFLDARWIQAVGGLPRRERLGSNHHRRAIATLWPDLLAFPTGAGGPMARRAPTLYYLSKDRSVGYSPFDRVIRDARVHEIVAESSLDEILPKDARIAAMRDAGPVGELLLTLAFAAELGTQAAASGATKGGELDHAGAP
jgi:asparagine synthase (glutamine-hydrolysing)